MEFEERLKDDRFSEMCSKSIILDQSNRVEMMRISIIRDPSKGDPFTGCSTWCGCVGGGVG